jgi:phosphatidyl-myo-inositol alpha-mannosyltransferase
MRVALACPYDWDAPGGVQVHVRELGERLRRRGHEVLVVTPARGRPVEPWVRRVGSPVAIPYNRSVAPICVSPASWRRVREALATFDPDVVHAHEPLTPSTSMLALLAARVPVVATFHSGAERSLAFDVAAPVLRLVARRIEVRVAVSGAAASFAARRIGDGFRIVPNGIDAERFASATAAELPGRRRALFVGRLDPRKGFAHAVAAFGRLADRYPDLVLVVAGDGPDRRAVDALPRDARARVLLLGRVENRDLPPYLAAADVLLAPSVGGESFGVVLAEAMAAGVPVVASEIPGYDEVVTDGVEGLLVPPRDPAAVARAAARVLDDARLASALAAGGRARAKLLSWDVVTDRLEELYREVVR